MSSISILYSIFAIRAVILFVNHTRLLNTSTIEIDFTGSYLGMKVIKLNCFSMNLKTYFSYEKYANIYKFYEDYRYQRAEKKFKYLVKFDLQSCFDSIYTHTISWATAGGANKVKVLPGYHGSWVGDAFDNLMQSVNAQIGRAS